MKQMKLTMATAKRGLESKTSTPPPRSHTEKRPDLKQTPTKLTQVALDNEKMNRKLFHQDSNDAGINADGDAIPVSAYATEGIGRLDSSETRKHRSLIDYHDYLSPNIHDIHVIQSQQQETMPSVVVQQPFELQTSRSGGSSSDDSHPDTFGNLINPIIPTIPQQDIRTEEGKGIDLSLASGSKIENHSLSPDIINPYLRRYGPKTFEFARVDDPRAQEQQDITYTFGKTAKSNLDLLLLESTNDTHKKDALSVVLPATTSAKLPDGTNTLHLVRNVTTSGATEHQGVQSKSIEKACNTKHNVKKNPTHPTQQDSCPVELTATTPLVHITDATERRTKRFDTPNNIYHSSTNIIDSVNTSEKLNSSVRTLTNPDAGHKICPFW